MAFEGVQIHSLRNGGTPIDGYREDLVQGDTLLCSLTGTAGVSTYRWEILGRPEGSVAGGAGPEPCALGTGATGTFVCDTDAPPVLLDGSYLVQCIVNENTPTETRISAMLVRLSTSTTADGQPLRILAGYEVDQDTADPLVKQGYAKMINRWLRNIATLGGSGAPSPPGPGGSTTQLAIPLRNDSLVAVPANRVVHFNDSTYGAFTVVGDGGFLVGNPFPNATSQVNIGVTLAAIAPGATGSVAIAGLAEVQVEAGAYTPSVSSTGVAFRAGAKVYVNSDGLTGTMKPPFGRRFVQVGYRIGNVSWTFFGGGLLKVLLRPYFSAPFTEEISGFVPAYSSIAWTTIAEFYRTELTSGLVEAVFTASPVNPSVDYTENSQFKRIWSFGPDAAGTLMQINGSANVYTFQGNPNHDVRAIVTTGASGFGQKIALQVTGVSLSAGANWTCTSKWTALPTAAIPLV